MTLCLRDPLRGLGEGELASVSSVSASGNEVAIGVVGTHEAVGIGILINSPGNMRKGMRADAPLEGPLWLRRITSLLLAEQPSRIGVMDKYSDPFPPLKKTRAVSGSPAKSCKYSSIFLLASLLLLTSTIFK